MVDGGWFESALDRARPTEGGDEVEQAVAGLQVEPRGTEVANPRVEAAANGLRIADTRGLEQRRGGGGLGGSESDAGAAEEGAGRLAEARFVDERGGEDPVAGLGPHRVASEALGLGTPRAGSREVEVVGGGAQAGHVGRIGADDGDHLRLGGRVADLVGAAVAVQLRQTGWRHDHRAGATVVRPRGDEAGDEDLAGPVLQDGSSSPLYRQTCGHRVPCGRPMPWREAHS